MLNPPDTHLPKGGNPFASLFLPKKPRIPPYPSGHWGKVPNNGIQYRQRTHRKITKQKLYLIDHPYSQFATCPRVSHWRHIPQFEAVIVRLADQAVERVIIISAVSHRIGIGRLRDAAGGIVGEYAGVAADTMGFEPVTGAEIARVHLAISFIASF